MSMQFFSRTKRGYQSSRASFLFAALVIAGSAGAATCRVAVDGTSGGDGSDWAHAMTLQGALATNTCNELWVKTGTYSPTTGNYRFISFKILRDIALYGGFAGNEESRNERDPTSNPTILSGDIGAIGDDSDNSYHVVYLDGTKGIPITASTVLDGFTIRDGRALKGSSGFPDIVGGGLYCNGSKGTSNQCNPTLRNLMFLDNSANAGGAMYNDGNSGTSSPSLTNVTFIGNTAVGAGAMYNAGRNGASSPTLVAVTFSNNSSSDSAGAIVNSGTEGGTSSPSLASVTFSNNHGDEGGAMYNEASGIGGASNPTLTNVTLSGNTARYGGAIFSAAVDGGNSSPTLTNVTFSGNHASINGGAIYNYRDTGGANGGISSPTMNNVILWGDSATTSGPEIFNSNATPILNDSVVQGGCPTGSICANVITADPLLGTLQKNGGATETMLPGNGSSAIDSGNNSTCTATDQRGVSRPQGAQCDIGAVEVVLDIIFADGFDYLPI